MPRPIRAVLFDLDGTFADTAPDLGRALNRTLALHGEPVLPLDLIRPHVSHGARALICFGFRLTPEAPRFEPLRQDLLRFYTEEICVETRLFPGMAELVEELEARGVRWGIVTNKPARFTDPLMEQLGYARRAACVVSGDTLEFSKPHPAPILHACDLAGATPEECIYVGDAERDIEAGRRAGTRTLAALFGYIGGDDRCEEWGADGMVASPGEIIDWIGGGER